MNHIYKIVWNRAKHCYTVASEIAKSAGKSAGAGKKAILAAALAAMALTGMSGTVSAADPTKITTDVVFYTIEQGYGTSKKTVEEYWEEQANNLVSSGEYTKVAWSREICNSLGYTTNPYVPEQGKLGVNVVTSATGSIALGNNAVAYLEGGSKSQNLLFGSKVAIGGIAIGENTKALNDSVSIGINSYTGEMGNVNLSGDTPYNVGNNKGQFSYTDSGALGMGSTTIGSNSYSAGSLTTNIGTYNISTTDYNNGKGGDTKYQNFGSTMIGAMNSIESYGTTADGLSGRANSVVGLANKTNNANGSLIFGAGNAITNSIDEISSPYSIEDSVTATANKFRTDAKTQSGGAVMAIGNGNTADYVKRSLLMGVNNAVTGSADAITESVSLIGNNNTVSKTGNKIYGDNHKVTGTNNVIIGSADRETETTASNAVIIGHNANATADGGVALGEKSAARREAGSFGGEAIAYANDTNDTSSTWKSTAAAVSVGDTSNGITRQITGVAAGSEDTDAVNVAQLKKIAAQAKSDAIASATDTHVKAGTYSVDNGNVDLSLVNKDGSAAGTVTIANVAKASDVGEVTNINQSIYKDGDTKNIVTAVNNIDNRVTSNAQSINNLYGHVDRLDHKINKVGAGAAALAALHPLDFDADDKWDFAAGFGNYASENAVAVGAFYRPNENTMFSVGGSFGNGENMVNAGVSFKFGSGSDELSSKAKMKQVIERQGQELTEANRKIDEQGRELAEANRKIESLTEAVEALLAQSKQG